MRIQSVGLLSLPLLTTGCMARPAAHPIALAAYTIEVHNATGEDIVAEYCTPVGPCSRLGNLAGGERASYVLPSEAAVERYANRVVVVGYVDLGGRSRRQVALQPALLVRGQPVLVSLSRKDPSRSSR